jgi:hypothetical protein
LKVKKPLLLFFLEATGRLQVVFKYLAVEQDQSFKTLHVFSSIGGVFVVLSSTPSVDQETRIIRICGPWCGAGLPLMGFCFAIVGEITIASKQLCLNFEMGLSFFYLPATAACNGVMP